MDSALKAMEVISSIELLYVDGRIRSFKPQTNTKI